MSIRTERVAALLKSDIGEILQKDYQHGAIVTVTNVRMSPDLMHANVYLSILSKTDSHYEHFEFITEKTPEIRKKLAGKIRHQVRKIPELHIHLDDTSEYVEKIEYLFQKIQSERDRSQPNKNESNSRESDSCQSDKDS